VEAALTDEVASLHRQLDDVQARLEELEGPFGAPVSEESSDRRAAQVEEAASPLGLEVVEADCSQRPCLFRLTGPGQPVGDFDDAIDALVASMGAAGVTTTFCASSYPAAAPPEATIAVMVDDASELHPARLAPVLRRCRDLLGTR